MYNYSLGLAIISPLPQKREGMLPADISPFCRNSAGPPEKVDSGANVWRENSNMHCMGTIVGLKGWRPQNLDLPAARVVPPIREKKD